MLKSIVVIKATFLAVIFSLGASAAIDLASIDDVVQADEPWRHPCVGAPMCK